MTVFIVVGILAYLIGSISFSVILSKKMAGFDVRTKGSGNAGTTNMLREVGKKAALITLVCDILKGIVAILLAVLVGNITKTEDLNLLVQIAAVMVIFGHTFPIFFGFKGGKGIATGLGVVLLVNWQIGLISLVFALVLMTLTQMVSVGSCAVAVLYPILTVFITENYLVNQGTSYFIFSILIGAVVLFNHRKNIQRILNGTENKISFKK